MMDGNFLSNCSEGETVGFEIRNLILRDFALNIEGTKEKVRNSSK